jgi:hypothetical protein
MREKRGAFEMDKNKRNANLAASNDGFDLEVETMFNHSPQPASKAVFLNTQNEKNQMFPYSEAFVYDAEAEKLCGEEIEEYFQACLVKIKQAEASAREF